MSIKKHLSRAVAVLAIALAAATSFAPPAHAAAEIDTYGDYAMLAEALERVVIIYDRYGVSQRDTVASRIKSATNDARLFIDCLHARVAAVSDPDRFEFDSLTIRYMEGSLFMHEGTVLEGAGLSTLTGYGSSMRDLLKLYDTARCYERFLREENGAIANGASVASRSSYLEEAIGALRANDNDASVYRFNSRACRNQGSYSGTIEASGDDAGLGPVAPAILAGVAGIVVGAAGFAVVSRRRA